MVKPAALILTALYLIILGCAAPPPIVVEAPPEEEINTTPQDETFDPLTLNEEDIINLTPSGLKPYPSPGSAAENEPSSPVTSLKEVQGYRVQIYVTGEEFEARAIEEEALLQFDESVYLIFDPPNYKIRVGNCLTRTQANALREKAAKLGYRDAWVVRSKVLVPVR
jgi:hypothetical protein